jgi:hypothetical protein
MYCKYSKYRLCGLRSGFRAAQNDSRRGTLPRAQRINPLTPKLNPSAQRCLTRFFTSDFAS